MAIRLGKFKSRTRVVAGKKAKTRGQQWENLLRSSAGFEGWYTVRLPDGCKQISQNNIIRVKTPFDFIFVRNGNAIFADAKTTKAKNFSRSMIDPFQVKELAAISNQGLVAGYIIRFELTDQVIFFHSHVLLAVRPNSSLDPKDGIVLGNSREISLEKIFPPTVNSIP